MKGLNKLYYLKLEIEELRYEIDNIPEISSSKPTGMPHSNSISDPVWQLQLKKQKLVDRLSKKMDKYLDELARIEDIIEKIDDEEVRAIARMRFIQNLKWEDIGRKMDYDRSVCYRKLKKYFSKLGRLENDNTK